MIKLFFFFSACLLPFFSYAEPGIPESFQEFDDWRTFVLRSEQEELARSCSLGNSYELCIDYYKNRNKHLFTMIIAKNPPAPSNTEPFAFKGALQVDSNNVYSGSGMYMEDDANIYLMFGEFANSFINFCIKSGLFSEIGNPTIMNNL